MYDEMAHLGDRHVDTIHGGGQNASALHMMENFRMIQLPVMTGRRCEPQSVIQAEAARDSCNVWFSMREHTAAGGT